MTAMTKNTGTMALHLIHVDRSAAPNDSLMIQRPVSTAPIPSIAIAT